MKIKKILVNLKTCKTLQLGNTYIYLQLSRKLNALSTHKTFENGTVIEMLNMDESGELWCTPQNEFGMDKTSRLIIVKHRKFEIIYFSFNKRQRKPMLGH